MPPLLLPDIATPARRARALRTRRLLVLLGAGAILLGALSAPQSAPASEAAQAAGAANVAAQPAPYAPGSVVVGYEPSASARARTASAHAAGADSEGAPPGAQGAEASVRVLHLEPGVSVPSALQRLRSSRDVSFAVPDYVAHASGEPASAVAASGQETPTLEPFIPINAGSSGTPGGWQALQWNFTGTESV